MSYYDGLSSEELQTEIASLEQELAEIKARGLKLNMARGKPSKRQLDLSSGMLDAVNSSSDCIDEGVDCRNYGCLEGIPSARKFMAEYLDAKPEQVIIYGQSSLNLMFDMLVHAELFGVLGNTPWKDQGTIKFLCPSPGYDRHFAMCEKLGMELITIELTGHGPNMEQVREYIQDPQVKGIWCVPKYSNPTGETYSDEVVRALASMEPAAPDFRIFWDNAYTEHHLYEEHDELLPVLAACEEAGNPDRVYVFGSTSKVALPGAGVSALASSEANIKEFLSIMKYQTVGHDKLNQLRLVRYFGSLEGLRAHMRKQAELIRPKFDIVCNKFREGFGGLDIARWTEPKGGYFISFDGPDGTAQEVVKLAAEHGVVVTSAGATYPYGKDPHDSNIRIAPTLLASEDLSTALDVFVVCVKYAAARKAGQIRE